MSQKRPDEAVVRAIIRCCRSQIVVSALGIEKAEEWMWLESAGISHFQGDLFAQPYLEGAPSIAWPEKKEVTVKLHNSPVSFHSSCGSAP